MPRKAFFDHISFFGPTGRILVGVGAAGALIALVLRREGILTGAALSLGLGLAMIFLREAFRPKLKTESEAAVEIPPTPWMQRVASASIVIATVLGVVFKSGLFYVVLAVIVASIAVAVVLGKVAPRT